jgi:hypothetical protein
MLGFLGAALLFLAGLNLLGSSLSKSSAFPTDLVMAVLGAASLSAVLSWLLVGARSSAVVTGCLIEAESRHPRAVEYEGLSRSDAEQLANHRRVGATPGQG